MTKSSKSYIINSSLNKNIFAVTLLLFNLSFYLLGKFQGIEIRGIFFAVIVGVIFLFIPKSYNGIFYIIFLGILLANLFILTSNTFFGNIYLLKPYISSEENVYEKVIERSIQFFGQEFRLRRSTGIIDNIHVSTFINLILVYFSFLKKWKILFIIALIVLFLNLNLQFIIIFIIWFIFENKNIQVSIWKSLLFFLPIVFFILFLIDQLLFGGAYSNQISSTNFGVLTAEFTSYIKIMNVWNFLYGLPSGHDDFYDSGVDYYIPLTDIGLIGIPFQYGLFGIFSIILLCFFWIKYSTKRLSFFLIVCMFSALHYFSIISSLSIILVFILIKLDPYLIYKKEVKSA